MTPMRSGRGTNRARIARLVCERSAQQAVAALAVLVLAAPASAQTTVFGMNVEGEVEAGVRVFLDKPSESRRAKFEEYRDIPDGAFLRKLRLHVFQPEGAYSSDIEASRAGQEDQELSFRTGRLGLWQFGFDWDQMRHIYSTNARSLGTSPRQGLITLPDAQQGGAAGILQLHNAAPEREISQRWDTARLSLMLTPTADLDLRAQYTRIHKDGDRPFSLVFGSPGGNFWEVPEPIDQTIQDFRLRGTLMRERWQLQGGYTFSMFQNAVKSLIVDNPVSAVFTALPGAVPAAGQISLPPDNMAHTINIQGAVSLPMRTRLSANVGYSLRYQNDPLLPHTINPVILAAAAPTNNLALPSRSLDGLVGTTMVNLNATTRPWSPLTLSLKYRLFDHDSMSRQLVFPGHVINDQGAFVSESRRAHGFEYMRQNADVDARVQVLRPVAVTVGGGWERYDRNEHREVPESDEVMGKLVLDVSPLDWAAIRLAYRPAFRRINTYNTFAHAAHTLIEEDVADATRTGQSTFLRKFDEGERDRHRIEGSLMLDPLEAVTVTLSGDWRQDQYLGGVFGLREAESWSTGIDLSWTPTERVTVSGGYMHERTSQLMRSRSRPVVGGAIDFTDYDWTTDIVDTIDTIYTALKATIVPKVLDWTASASYAYALGRVDNRNPVTPTSGLVTQQATANVKPWPASEDTLIRIDTALRYHFAKAWTASLGYAFESFQKNDWRAERVNPFTPGVTSIWMGNDAQNYAAHIVGVMLAFRWHGGP